MGACVPEALDTIRTDFLVLPARLVREHKKNIVKLLPRSL